MAGSAICAGDPVNWSVTVPAMLAPVTTNSIPLNVPRLVSNWLIEPDVFNGRAWFVNEIVPPAIESADSAEQAPTSKANGRNDLKRSLQLRVN
jgi:hypothetical protein